MATCDAVNWWSFPNACGWKDSALVGVAPALSEAVEWPLLLLTVVLLLQRKFSMHVVQWRGTTLAAATQLNGMVGDHAVGILLPWWAMTRLAGGVVARVRFGRHGYGVG